MRYVLAAVIFWEGEITTFINDIWQVSELKGVGRVAEPLGVCAITPGNVSDCGGEKTASPTAFIRTSLAKVYCPRQCEQSIEPCKRPATSPCDVIGGRSSGISPNAGQFE